jgi:hypothetical protein
MGTRRSGGKQIVRPSLCLNNTGSAISSSIHDRRIHQLKRDGNQALNPHAVGSLPDHESSSGSFVASNGVGRPDPFGRLVAKPDNESYR